MSSELTVQATLKTKKCSKCKKRLALSLFYRMKQSKDGYQPRCKACQKKYNSARQRRKRFLQQNGKSPIQKAQFVNELHLKRARQTQTDITSEWMIEQWHSTKSCPLCHRKLASVPGRPTSRNLDHIVPISEGGRHVMANVRIICRTCNLTRKYKPSEEHPGLRPGTCGER